MIFYLIYKLGQLTALVLPLKLAYAVAVFLSDLHHIVAYKDRRNVIANLKAIFTNKSDKELKNIMLAMSRNFAKYLVDFFRFENLTKENIHKYVHIENLHYVNESLKGGKGVILLSAHVGNWELGGVAMALLGYAVSAVALPHRHKAVDNFFNAQRESKGLKVIPLGRAVRECFSLLKENKLIALLGDRGFSDRGILLHFFGKPTLLPKGPAAISLKSGAPIVPVFMVRNKDDTFTLRFFQPIECHPTHEKDRDMQHLIEAYKVLIEDCIRQYPEQWFMFPRFWQE